MKMAPNFCFLTGTPLLAPELAYEERLEEVYSFEGARGIAWRVPATIGTFLWRTFPARTAARTSHVQNRDWHRANDCIAVDPEVAAIGIALGNQQIRFRLLHRLAQHLRHVPTAD